MVGEGRINEIVKAIKKIQESKQPVKKYFENNFVPFSISKDKHTLRRNGTCISSF